MNDSQALDAESMSEAFKSGYTRSQIVRSIALALVLHGAIIGGYLVISSEKKGPESVVKETEKKVEESKDTAKKAPGAIEAATESTKGAAKSGESKGGEASKHGAEAPKNDETAKPGEIPSAPDSDIDSILKAR
jgi:hypothetical protein